MATQENISPEKKTDYALLFRPDPLRFGLSLSLFLLALLPRAYDLQRFVTADEAKWVYRSAQFLAALLRGDWPATSVNLTPAVTTTWLGSLGLAFYYQLHCPLLNSSLAGWLTTLPEFRVELEVLAATRWPVVILTSLGVVALYLLAARLFDPTLAFLAAAFLALDPYPVALSRILGHDAPTVVFMSLSLLLLLLAVNGDAATRRRRDTAMPGQDAPPTSAHSASLLRRVSPSLFLTLSAVAAGLAFLSKAPALFLIPFAALVLIGSEARFGGKHRAFWLRWFKPFIIWLGGAYLTFVLFWPAAWVDPLGRPLAVFENAFLSATDQEEADGEGYWLVPDLGPFYYLVNGGFKLSPLVMIGAGLSIFFWASPHFRKPALNHNALSLTPSPRHPLAASPLHPFTPSPFHPLTASPLSWLLLFVLLFTVFMTLSDKRSPRYILPIFPCLAIMAAHGWLQLYQVASGRVAGSQTVDSKVISFTLHAIRNGQFIFSALLILSALAILLPYAPYYFTYFNPLLGGPLTAPRLVKIGWGEGLDQVGRFLQREDRTRSSRVGTAYASTVAPYFEGDLASVAGDHLDYVVLYSKQVQSGEPSPEFIRYFQQLGPIFSVKLNGLPYADVYPGPALKILPPPAPEENRRGGLPQPLGFRPLAAYGHIGELLEVDVVWQADDPLPVVPATVTLAPVAALDRLKTDDQAGSAALQSHDITALATGDGLLARTANGLVVSRHRLALPADLARGPYALLVDGRPLGEIELRRFQIPQNMGRVNQVVFGEQIALAAYQFEPTADYIGLTLAWQAHTAPLPDYTVFVQILAAGTHARLAGVDARPQKGEWPTSRWVKGEVVVDEYLVAIPPDLPPGFYEIIAGLYAPETGQRLTLANGQDHWTLPWTYIQK